MSETSDSHNCQLCGQDAANRDAMKLHLLKHLDYRKYPCGNCLQAFFTPAEREEHCKATAHIHAFEEKVNQYAEMQLSTLLNDMSLVASHGVEAVVRHKARKILELNAAVQKEPFDPQYSNF